MSAPETQFFTAPNIDQSGSHRLAYYDWGNPNAEQVIVCVHGLSRNARDFDFLAEELVSKGARVLALSMAGRGESDRLENPMLYGYPTYVADCLAFLDNFHLRHVNWVGTSMGGIIGMMIAAQGNERIRRLVLNDIGSFLKKEALSRIYGYVSTLPTQFASREEAENYYRTNFAPWGIVEDAHWAHFLTHSTKANADGTHSPLCDPAIAEPLAAISQNYTQVDDINLAEIWDKIILPTLILRGEDSDILDQETVNAMRRTNPHAHAATIANCGHAPALAAPDQIMRISQFLCTPVGAIPAIGI